MEVSAGLLFAPIFGMIQAEITTRKHYQIHSSKYSVNKDNFKVKFTMTKQEIEPLEILRKIKQNKIRLRGFLVPSFSKKFRRHS